MAHSKDSLSDHQAGQVIKACHISCVGSNVQAFFRGQFDYLQKQGFAFTVITSEPTRDGLGLPDETAYHSIPLTRSITPFTDIRSIWRLYRIFRRNKFDLVQYTTPKGALLGSIAAWLARAPVRLYLMWGIYYVGQSGLKRWLFRFLDRLACRLSTHIAFDGSDTRLFAIADKLCRGDQSTVVGHGSANGIDLNKFNPDRLTQSGLEVRQQWAIPQNAKVIGSVMRLVGDKGVNELVSAFDLICQNHPEVYLLLVGPEEEKDKPLSETIERMRDNPRIITVGQQTEIAAYYAAMDCFALPTYREGFGVVNLEAAAMRLPVVTTDAIGARGSIIDDQTGILVQPKNVKELTEALVRLLDDTELSWTMGHAGRKWVEENFEQGKLWKDILQHRQQLLIDGGRIRRH